MEHSEVLSSLRQTNTLILFDAQRQCWLFFCQPIQILKATDTTEVLPLLETVQQQVNQQGYYAAGFVSYEAAPAFDRSFQVYSNASLKPESGEALPLAWFGLYAQPQVVSLPATHIEETPSWIPSISRDRYRAAIDQIKRYIAQGQTYQVNFSFRLQAPFSTDPEAYFLQLIQAQESQYGAFVNLEDWAICCASPELFFRWNDRTLMCRPMKGTAPRGLTYLSDRALASELQRSAKNRAENVMIVDMIRNDMGRIAETGSVQVTHLFDVEQYPTLWQMTSPVQCQTEASFVEIFRALFPCASITGAPKSRTMEIIAELEDSPRQIYTGSIGYLAPDRTAQFNVAIRTVLINKTQQTAEYGVGGGIVWDSVETDEFEECCTKAKILTQSHPSFELLETLRWTPEKGYFLLDLHLQRLQESAAYFAFKLSLDQVQEQLEAIAQTLPQQAHKVRLRVTKAGHLALEAEGLTLTQTPLKIGLAPFSSLFRSVSVSQNNSPSGLSTGKTSLSRLG
jgi:para-aminobenzoate synthetase / 4-amino-4-deoxychorismate lyase